MNGFWPGLGVNILARAGDWPQLIAKFWPGPAGGCDFGWPGAPVEI